MSYVATFKNARTTILAESKCKEIDLKVTVIATPTTISSECGMSLLVEKERLIDFEKLMVKNAIQYNIYDR